MSPKTNILGKIYVQRESLRVANSDHNFFLIVIALIAKPRTQKFESCAAASASQWYASGWRASNFRGDI
jgi:hypothetical protein